jgi:asparagine N-glycosylation enzyme membrane subunit Stt3
LAVQRTVASARLAAGFSLSLLLFFWFGWEIHDSVSHTLALLAAALALFIVSTSSPAMAALLLFTFATGSALFGISRFAIHYLFPFSLFAALALAGLLAQRAEERRFSQRLAIISLAAALVIFFVKLASFYVVPGSSEATYLLLTAAIGVASLAR